MKIKCEYCQNEYDSKNIKCPYCGAVSKSDSTVSDSYFYGKLSLIFAICGFCCYPLGLIFWTAAIIFAIVDKKKNKKMSEKAVAGLIISSTLPGILIVVAIILAMTGQLDETTGLMFEQQIENEEEVEETPENNSDYKNAEEFENDLRFDENTTGKTVTFVVKDVRPDSSLGYNIWAGKHLNFIATDNIGVIHKGDVLTVRITETTRFDKIHYKIYFELIEIMER